MMKIPRTMSTQHPDNVRQPFFVENSIIAGDDEIKEAFYSFSHLKIKEQLWDCEGKEVDNFVVEKLLTRYEDYFHKNRIGKDIFITLRGPNPRVEKGKGKLLLETLESIPRNFDTARQFYGDDASPIFEMAIPMTSSAEEIFRVKDYYDTHIIKRQEKKAGDSIIKDWLGDFKPESINVIPLMEDKESMLDSAKIVEEYIAKARIKEYQRVWLARSDPALNYGSLSAVLINKIALQRLHALEERTSIDLYPIIGCGSAPFRGNFRPDNHSNCTSSYPSVQTFTMQSAYKFDYPEDAVRDSVNEIESAKRKQPVQIDEDEATMIIQKASAEYQKHVSIVAPVVNQISGFVPKRRKRKLHIGLFGYSRETSGITLPRAITYCAAMYSIGLPPELLGLSALSGKELESVSSKPFEEDMQDSLRYFNRDSLKLFPESFQKDMMDVAGQFDYETDERHLKVTNFILKGLKNNEHLTENIERAASIRNFLG
jgi:phosphoenolpyruvate carboxylase